MEFTLRKRYPELAPSCTWSEILGLRSFRIEERHLENELFNWIYFDFLDERKMIERYSVAVYESRYAPFKGEVVTILMSYDKFYRREQCGWEGGCRYESDHYENAPLLGNQFSIMGLRLPEYYLSENYLDIKISKESSPKIIEIVRDLEDYIFKPEIPTLKSMCDFIAAYQKKKIDFVAEKKKELQAIGDHASEMYQMFCGK